MPVKILGIANSMIGKSSLPNFPTSELKIIHLTKVASRSSVPLKGTRLVVPIEGR